MARKRFDVLRRIAHRDRQPYGTQHLAVVVAIPNGHHLCNVNAKLFAQHGDRIAFRCRG
ncbi:hypothetical protein SDC9_195833 [bioreactor metagenome]|uniref:Uncharacterized protein n=1 Tax=bioreactor metagenome TaxID=1076179 RepID=A0A645IAD9_9ZZZZ